MKSKYFVIKELVSKQVYEKYGEGAWKFIDEKLIITLDQIREFFGKPIIVNVYSQGLEQRGLRANCDYLVKDKTDKGILYISQHVLGKGADLNVIGLSVPTTYQAIIDNQDKFPYLKRMENIKLTPTWIHIDVANTESEELEIFG